MKSKAARSLAALAASVLIGSAARGGDLDTNKIVELFKYRQNLPPDVTATMGELKDAPIAGMKSGTIKLSRGMQSQDVEVLVTGDGKYAIFGAKLEDLSVDLAAEKAKKAQEEAKKAEETVKKISLKDKPAKGPKNAKVTIVEYSDFQCPFCARAHVTLSEVLKEYEGKVRVAYGHFPLPFHNWAEVAGVAAACAQQQDEEAFWKLYDFLFEHQKEITAENVKDKSIEGIAGTKVNKEKFAECYDKKATLDRVKADVSEGQSIGVSGTPAFFINGRMLSGAQPAAKFKEIIDQELKGGKS